MDMTKIMFTDLRVCTHYTPCTNTNMGYKYKHYTGMRIHHECNNNKVVCTLMSIICNMYL